MFKTNNGLKQQDSKHEVQEFISNRDFEKYAESWQKIKQSERLTQLASLIDLSTFLTPGFKRSPKFSTNSLLWLILLNQICFISSQINNFPELQIANVNALIPATLALLNTYIAATSDKIAGIPQEKKYIIEFFKNIYSIVLEHAQAMKVTQNLQDEISSWHFNSVEKSQIIHNFKILIFRMIDTFKPEGEFIQIVLLLVEIVKKLDRSPNELFESTNELNDDRSLLLKALLNNYCSFTPLAFSHGTDPNRLLMTGMTEFQAMLEEAQIRYHIFQNNLPGLIELYLNAGANVDNTFDTRPGLMRLAILGHWQAIELLVHKSKSPVVKKLVRDLALKAKQQNIVDLINQDEKVKNLEYPSENLDLIKATVIAIKDNDLEHLKINLEWIKLGLLGTTTSDSAIFEFFFQTSFKAIMDYHRFEMLQALSTFYREYFQGPLPNINAIQYVDQPFPVSPLLTIIDSSNIEELISLLKMGADPNYELYELDHTPIRQIYTGQEPILLYHPTCFHMYLYRAGLNNIETFKALLQYGADIDNPIIELHKINLFSLSYAAGNQNNVDKILNKILKENNAKKVKIHPLVKIANYNDKWEFVRLGLKYTKNSEAVEEVRRIALLNNQEQIVTHIDNKIMPRLKRPHSNTGTMFSLGGAITLAATAFAYCFYKKAAEQSTVRAHNLRLLNKLTENIFGQAWTCTNNIYNMTLPNFQSQEKSSNIYKDAQHIEKILAQTAYKTKLSNNNLSIQIPIGIMLDENIIDDHIVLARRQAEQKSLEQHRFEQAQIMPQLSIAQLKENLKNLEKDIDQIPTITNKLKETHQEFTQVTAYRDIGKYRSKVNNLFEFLKAEETIFTDIEGILRQKMNHAKTLTEKENLRQEIAEISKKFSGVKRRTSDVLFRLDNQKALLQDIKKYNDHNLTLGL